MTLKTRYMTTVYSLAGNDLAQFFEDTAAEYPGVGLRLEMLGQPVDVGENDQAIQQTIRHLPCAAVRQNQSGHARDALLGKIERAQAVSAKVGPSRIESEPASPKPSVKSVLLSLSARAPTLHTAECGEDADSRHYTDEMAKSLRSANSALRDADRGSDN